MTRRSSDSVGGAGSLQGATRGRALSGIRQLCMLGLWKDMQAQGIEVQRLEMGGDRDNTRPWVPR